MDIATANRTRCGGPCPDNTGVIAHDEETGAPYWACRGPGCANWRWLEDKRTEAYIAAVVDHMKKTGDGYNKAVQEVLKRRSEFAYAEGFCGPAGGPQTGVGVP